MTDAAVDRPRSAARPGPAGWLALAATPTFAVLALGAIVYGGPGDLLCSAHGPLPLTGMAPMYALMSAFHAAPWLRLLTSRRTRDEG